MASDMFLTLSGPLANNYDLMNFVETIVVRNLADGTYSVEFQMIIDIWKRQQEFYQSAVYKNRLLEIQQEAAASASGQ